MMTSRQRMLTAIDKKIPDRLPVTTHHVMPYFLNKHMNGISNQEFFEFFGLDPIHWITPLQPYGDLGKINGVYDKGNEKWRLESEDIPDTEYNTKRYHIHTPKKILTLVLQSNDQTGWLAEHPIKDNADIEILAEYMPDPLCNVEAVNKAALEFGNKALIRGHIPGFDMFGQPGCWQDACCIVGVERMIMATFEDPEWVHTLLKIFLKRKKKYIKSLEGAKYDLIELGGGDASTTVISPKLFDEFVAPYDSELIQLAHEMKQRITYHTCGGMMPILENIAAMKPDVMETFTPPDMGADVDLAEAKRRIGDKVCMIGGFDQFHFFQGCSPQKTREAVRRCFEQAGDNGGFILSPSDHFFDADIELIKAFADEAGKCKYPE
jgi:uroporphyrinogen decarboxylase